MNASGNKIDKLIDKFKNEKMNTPQIPSINKPTIGTNRPDLRFDKLRRPQNLAFTQRTNELELDKNDKKLKEIMKSSGKLLIKDQIYDTDIKDLIQIEELGTGTCGHVVKMRHKPSNEIIAVKQMRRTGNNKEENKRIVMDIEVNKSHDCPYIVQCLGCFITEPEVWICMELMATCFDKLSKRLKQPIPENILGKVTVATVKALAYLKDKHGIIHRDVKPSNILLDEKGNVKLCDFGISGRLVDSMAATKSAGCTAYLAPERIEINPSHPEYDIRADVWSLGITLVELATGKFPYQDCKTDFEVLTKVIGQDPPSLPDDQEFSPEFRSFVKCCLIKDQMQRPKYVKLKKEPFYKRYETAVVDVGAWYRSAMQELDGGSKDSSRQNSKTSSTSQFRRVLHTRQHSEPPPPRRHFLNGTEPTQQPFPPTEDFTDGRSVHMSRLATFNERQNRNFSPNFYHDRQESCFLQKRERWNSPVTSPLPHHRNMHEDTSLHYNSGNTSPIVLQRFLHQQKQQQQAKDAEEYLKNDTGRRRLPSYIKQMSNDRSGRSSRHQSPEPPPRLNRGVGENQSPLAIRRHILEPNPNSPGFSRRYISPTPPVPPPRRLSESTSVPGSPQHVRAKFHYTPEPQRRLFKNHDVS